MDKAKIRLSPKEADLVSNADWILTKNGILLKARYILEEVQEKQQRIFNSIAGVPSEVRHIPPKISKGENYLGLPYLILDYPRYFEHDNYFAIRTMFWWGNFFSITLHMSGAHKDRYLPSLTESFAEMKESGIYFCINEDEWQHHLGPDNYLALKSMDDAAFVKHMQARPFIKLARSYPLKEWEKAEETLVGAFRQMIEWLGFNSLDDEKGL
ncbi:MAG: hypothetical protein H7Y42_07205 [Chitinophagaceae bacterium]|nr:hypothetical protein [Chitinophagaceae bacterium]